MQWRDVLAVYLAMYSSQRGCVQVDSYSLYDSHRLAFVFPYTLTAERNLKEFNQVVPKTAQPRIFTASFCYPNS